MKKKLQQTTQKYKKSWDYYEQIYNNKINNLEEMNKFWKKYNLLKLNQVEIENMNRPITSMEIKTVIKDLSTKKSPGPDSFIGEFYQNYRDELTAILLKLFQKIVVEKKTKLPNSL